MIETIYIYDGDKISYEVVEKGYKIYKGGKLWITQEEPFIPNKDLSYEENALAQIEEICAVSEAEPTVEEQITEMQLAITELYETMLGGAE